MKTNDDKIREAFEKHFTKEFIHEISDGFGGYNNPDIIMQYKWYSIALEDHKKAEAESQWISGSVEMEKVIEQEYLVTSPLNKELMLESFKSQLESTIFKELIQGEKHGLKITFSVEIRR